ncbi:hypothetical protein ABW21_db0206658 [Orbilia brochopaga]|nr:hypothetical protein ABW21_db0206658 [Drechslerella brochopaga]
MEEYIVNYKRVVTPIYPADAAAIVQSLDLHVSPEADPVNGPLEILEAGTGHGSLTLHLARAIFAGYLGKEKPAVILHSVESNPPYSICAQQMFGNFRRGQYVGSGVKFYVDSVEKWLRNELKTRNQARQTHDPTPVTPAAPEEKANAEHGHELDQHTNTSSSDETGSSTPSALPSSKDLPFLSACVLDLPDPRPILPLLTRAMRLDAVIGYWAPSITQIVSVVEHIRIQKLPFFVDKVLEFSNGAGASGARPWDVRVAKVRSRVRAREAAASPLLKTPSGNFHERFLMAGTEAKETDLLRAAFSGTPVPLPTMEEDSKEDPSDFEVVCRPKVGERTQGGGFYLMLRRVGHHRVSEETSPDGQSVSETPELPDLTDHDFKRLDDLLPGKETPRTRSLRASLAHEELLRRYSDLAAATNRDSTAIDDQTRGREGRSQSDASEFRVPPEYAHIIRRAEEEAKSRRSAFDGSTTAQARLEALLHKLKQKPGGQDENV